MSKIHCEMSAQETEREHELGKWVQTIIWHFVSTY